MRLPPATIGLLALAGALALSAPATAETVITGFGGIVFGGDLASGQADDFDTTNRHGVYGVGLASLGSPLGLELEFSHSPNFFGVTSAVPDNSLSTLMLNLVLSAHVGGRSRLYASAGGGLLKASVNDPDDLFDVSRNDFGADLGVGLLTGLGENLGLRADLRYFRNVGDTEPDQDLDIDFGSFDYWRATAGLAVRF